MTQAGDAKRVEFVPWCTIEIEQHGFYQIAVAPGRTSGYMAWGKLGKITGTDPIREPGEPVWFGFGATREEAKAEVLRDIEKDGAIAAVDRQSKLLGVATAVVAAFALVVAALRIFS